MIEEDEFLKTKEKKENKTKLQKLIYTAKCLKCNEFYVGQTKNSFNTR